MYMSDWCCVTMNRATLIVIRSRDQYLLQRFWSTTVWFRYLYHSRLVAWCCYYMTDCCWTVRHLLWSEVETNLCSRDFGRQLSGSGICTIVDSCYDVYECLFFVKFELWACHHLMRRLSMNCATLIVISSRDQPLFQRFWSTPVWFRYLYHSRLVAWCCYYMSEYIVSRLSCEASIIWWDA